ncbi:MAG TPA: hypothetical protein VGS28_01680 [Candidatus Saccharimonadales bacterium]|nr:hypothetical protein [Candidatus Saccharimonadales bacterium]
MNLKAQVKHIEGKSLAWRRLAVFFREESIYELIKTLGIYSRKGYFEYELRISSGYYDWTQARRDIQFRTDVFQPSLGFKGLYQQDPYGLHVKGKLPLSEKEINEVVEKLPPDIAEKYLLFSLTNINQGKFMKLISKLLDENSADDDIFYPPVQYRELKVDGDGIYYKNKPFEMDYPHRQAMRILIEKKGKPCDYEDFKDDDAGIFIKSIREYPNINHTIRNLIYELRGELLINTGKRLIENHEKGGWYLDI